MKRFFKFLIVTTLAIMMSVFAFAACGDNSESSSATSSDSSVGGLVHEKPVAGEGETVYTFKVVYPDGSPCEDVKIIYCKVENNIEVSCKPTALKTDSTGTVYQAIETGEYHIHVQACPEGYKDGYDVTNPLSAPAHVTATSTEATITLTEKTAEN